MRQQFLGLGGTEGEVGDAVEGGMCSGPAAVRASGTTVCHDMLVKMYFFRYNSAKQGSFAYPERSEAGKELKCR